VAPFFVEEVRKHLERQYGAKVLYEQGPRGHHHARRDLQDIANHAIEDGLRRYDKRHGWRRPARNILAETSHDRSFKDDRWNRGIAVGDVLPAVVVTAPKTGAARLRIGRLHADLVREGYTWTRRTSAADLFKPGDLVDVRIAKVDDASETVTVALEQTPLAEAALLAIDNKDRSDQGDGRRLEFQSQQVQPLGPGVSPVGIHIQTDRLHSRNRPRLHAGVDPHRRARQLFGGQQSDLQSAELRPQVSRPGDAPLRARGVAEHSCHQNVQHPRAEERPCLRQAVRVRGSFPEYSADRAWRRGCDASSK
jgi:hypothetical protein